MWSVAGADGDTCFEPTSTLVQYLRSSVCRRVFVGRLQPKTFSPKSGQRMRRLPLDAVVSPPRSADVRCGSTRYSSIRFHLLRCPENVGSRLHGVFRGSLWYRCCRQALVVPVNNAS